MYTCLKGCASTETDYCSVCGVKMTPALPPPKAPHAVAAVAAELCPDCGTSRVEQAKFCELCRFNFVTRESSSPSISGLLGKSASGPIASALAVWEAEVRSEIPDAPNSASSTFPLDLADLLIGRRSDTRDIHPEIPIEGDAAVSHRHAKLLRQAEGGFVVMDLGSSNGTKLNDTELKPGVRSPLKHGDELRVGRHTVIKLVLRT